MSGLVTLILVLSISLVGSLTQGSGGLEECTSIAEDTARLACFDAYAARVKAQDTESAQAEKPSVEQAVQAKEEQRQIEEQRQTEEQWQIEEQRRKEEQRQIEEQRQTEEQWQIEEQRRKEEQRQKDFGLTDAAIARRDTQKEARKQAQEEAQKEARKQAQEEAQKEARESQSAEPETKPEKPTKTAPDNLVAHVKEFTRNNRTKRIRITLDNGQVWQEIDANPFRGTVKPGAEVTIAKRRFGGYKIIIPNRSSTIFVRRIK